MFDGMLVREPTAERTVPNSAILGKP